MRGIIAFLSVGLLWAAAACVAIALYGLHCQLPTVMLCVVGWAATILALGLSRD